MNANDAMLTQLFTAQTGSKVPDNAPNANNPGNFDLVVEGVAGSVIGNSAQPYTLTITAIDLTTVAPPSTSINPTGNPFSQTFTTPTWTASGIDFESTQPFTISVPGGGGPGAPLTGHTLQYVASLWTNNHQVVSILQSPPFVLV
jgi:hypothetical protein